MPTLIKRRTRRRKRRQMRKKMKMAPNPCLPIAPALSYPPLTRQYLPKKTTVGLWERKPQGIFNPFFAPGFASAVTTS